MTSSNIMDIFIVIFISVCLILVIINKLALHNNSLIVLDILPQQPQVDRIIINIEPPVTNDNILEETGDEINSEVQQGESKSEDDQEDTDCKTFTFVFCTILGAIAIPVIVITIRIYFPSKESSLMADVMG